MSSRPAGPRTLGRVASSVNVKLDRPARRLAVCLVLAFVGVLAFGALTVALAANAETSLVSVSLSGNRPGNGASTSPLISSDGRYVAFTSAASDLVTNDTNGAMDVFVRDLLAGTTTLAR